MSDAPELSRRDVLLGMVQKEFPNYHPLISIARIAHHGDADLKTQLECHKTIAKYVEPELKSIEVKGELGHRHKVTVSMFEPQGATFSTVEAGLTPAIEGVGERVPRVEQSRDTIRELPGGGVIDTDPEVIDRVTRGW